MQQNEKRKHIIRLNDAMFWQQVQHINKPANHFDIDTDVHTKNALCFFKRMLFHDTCLVLNEHMD